MGVDHACFLMACNYENGGDTGLPKDLERAQYWAKKAIDKGHVKEKLMKEDQIASCARWAEGNFEVSE